MSNENKSPSSDCGATPFFLTLSRRCQQHLPVYLYVPNLMGYLRIILALWGLHTSCTRPLLTIVLWNLSASLDFLDGIVARKLQQTSTLGIYIDVFADNILRSSCWMAAAMKSNHLVLPLFIMSLEWITMLCTQLHQQQQVKQEVHWKDRSNQDSWLVRNIFQDNFRNPLGMLAIYGLFAANQFWYVSYYCNDLVEFLPQGMSGVLLLLFEIGRACAYIGRIISIVCEIHLCGKYLGLLIEKDTTEGSSVKESDKKDE